LTFKGWQKTSLIEFPGKIATVLFTGGCNFRCPFCYNGCLVQRPEELEDLPEESVLDFLKENAGLYQAVVVTGGEPTLEPQLPEFLRRVKALGLSTGLETNGTNPSMTARLLDQDLVDYIAIDVKAPLDWEAYGRAAGLPGGAWELLEGVKQTLETLRNAAVQIELRCTAVPGLHEPEDILRLADQLKGFPTFVLQQFVPQRSLDPGLRNRAPFDEEVLGRLHRRIEGFFLRCEVRGI
jgi:pyruvate formate lyase activating enzyme